VGFVACPKAPAATADPILGKLRGWEFRRRRESVPVAAKLAGIGPVEVAAVPLIFEYERLSHWRAVAVVPTGSHGHSQLVMLVYDLWASNLVLRVANDKVAVWKLLTCLLDELLRVRLTFVIVVIYDALHPRQPQLDRLPPVLPQLEQPQ